MNQLVSFGGNATLTMSSREIAELIGKQHSHIKISAERLAEKGIIGTLAMREFTHNGNTYEEYLLCKRDSLILVAQNCPEFTAVIVDRWQELERQAAIGQFKLPQSFAEALRLAADESERADRAMLERDEAVRTKAMIGSKREATAMATAAAAKREVQKLEVELDRSKLYATVKRVEAYLKQKFNWRELKKVSAEIGIPPLDVPDQNYTSVKSYHAEVWRRAFGVDISSMGGVSHAN